MILNCLATSFVVRLCDDIPFLPNGNKTPDKDSAACGEKVTYICNHCFTLVGDRELECQGDGSLHRQIPRCNSSGEFSLI